MSEGDKPEANGEDNLQSLIDSASIDAILQGRPSAELIISIRDSIQKGKDRIAELEKLVDEGSDSAAVKAALNEFIRQVDRKYSKAIWDAQPKDEFGFTTVAEMDKHSPFKDFYDGFKAQAGEEGSKVTEEMVAALEPYKPVLGKIYESRTHQFGHLFHSEQTRLIGKRLIYVDPITKKGKVDFAEMRKNPEKYKGFIESLSEAWRDIVERMDLEAEKPAAVEETIVTEESSEQSSASEESSESEEVVESQPASPEIQPVPEVVPGNLAGIYAKLDSIEKAVAGVAKKQQMHSRAYCSLYKELLETRAKLMEGQLAIRHDILDMQKGGYGRQQGGLEDAVSTQHDNSQAPGPQPAPSDDSNSGQPDEEKPGIDPEEMYQAAKRARRQGEYQEAMQLLIRASEGYEKKDYIYCEMGTLNLLVGEYGAAQQIFMQLASSNEVSEEVKMVSIHNLGYILEQAKRVDEAKQFAAIEPEQDPRIEIINLEQSLESGYAA